MSPFWIIAITLYLLCVVAYVVWMVRTAVEEPASLKPYNQLERESEWRR